MTLTLLLDLDDTLIGNKMETFVPAYIRSLSRRVAPLIHPDRFARQLLAATAQMTTNKNPNRWLAEVFDAHFFPELGINKGIVQPEIDAFYAQDFGKLRSTTELRPEAAQVVEQCLGAGCQIAIATNPLFPRTAVEQRLEWAGIPTQKYPFSLIASYEAFHFAKPHPEYYAELLGNIGWPEGPVVMVGDDLENDLPGAQQLGLPFFWIRNGLSAPAGLESLPQGELVDLPAWIKSTPPETLQPSFTQPEALLPILRSTIAILANYIHKLDASALSVRSKPDDWSVNEVVCHLRDADAEVNLPRIQQILSTDDPFLPGRNTDAWAEERSYIQQDCIQALQDFSVNRLQLLSLLESQPTSAWQRPARHAIFGPTHLAELAGFIANHDRVHIQQIAAEVAAHKE